MNKIKACLSAVINALRVVKESIEHLLNPTFCAACKTLDMDNATIVCRECAGKIVPVVSTSLIISSKYTLNVLAISAYQEPLKSLILAKKYSDRAVSYQLGQLIWEKTFFRHAPADVLVPIPLHWRRYARRGYNQAQEMALSLTALSGISTALLLKRTKNTSFQYGLSSMLRKKNVGEAFVINPSIDMHVYKDKHIVLVDDLMTTGSTLQEAARVLVPFKPRSISAVVVCRVI